MVGQSQTCPQVGIVTSFLVNLTWLTLTTALGLKIRDLGYNFFFLSWHPNANPAFKPAKSGQHGLAGGSLAMLLPLNYSKLHQSLLHLRATHRSVLLGP